MRKYWIVLLMMITSVCSLSYSQIAYQASIYGTDGHPLENTEITLKCSVLEGSLTGTEKYVETFNTSTSNIGYVTVNIGTGEIVSGIYSSINWNLSNYLKVEIDINGSGYNYLETKQFSKVPYSSISNSVINEQDQLYINSISHGITSLNLANWNNLYSWGNHATAGYLLAETGDNDPTNEFELPTRTGMNGRFLKVVNSNSMEWYIMTNFAISGSYSDLSNKLVQGDNINITNNTVKINVSGQSIGDMIYYKNSDWIRLPKGTNGQYLKMNDTIPSWKSGDTIHYVGELYGGGIVFYTYDGGKHGLIATLKDFSCLGYWSEDSVNYNNVESYWKGDSNTYYASQQDPGLGSIKYTYTYCDFNGYIDWYVGSLTEMQLMMKQAYVINSKLESDSDPETIGLITDISNGNYWSSTECSNTSQAYSVNWREFKIFNNKNELINKVRPIRKF
jgi:hypothetical protein